MLSPREREKRDRRERVQEMKERVKEERGTGMKVKKHEIKTFPLYLSCYKDSRPCLTVSQLVAPVIKIHDTFAKPDLTHNKLN